MNPKVDFFFTKAGKWQKEFLKLRSIMLDCGITEELKWGVPCYTYQGKNIVLIHGFKEYCALLFVKGSLLKDDKGLLIQQTEKVQSARQIRFTELKAIDKLEKMIKLYVFEAVEVEKSGVKVEFKKASDYEVPQEFQDVLSKNKTLKTAFLALTPGRQKSYLFYFSQAKQPKTRISRIEKSIPQILSGKD